MRKRFCRASAVTILLSGAGLVRPVLSQQASRGGVQSAGLLAGVNSAKIAADDADGPVDRRNAWMVGGFVELGAGRVRFRPEVLLSEKGGKQESNGATIVAKVRYLQVPLLLRFDAGRGTTAQPFVVFGPSIAFRVGCNVSVTSTGASLSVDCDKVNTVDPDAGGDPVKKSDLTGIIGGGVDFGVLSLGVRYDHGLSNIASNGSSGNAYTRTITLLGGYRWRKR